MVKSELVQLITEQNPHLRQRDVEQIINTVFGEIIHALSLGDRVELRGFGAFSVREHEAKIGRNPRTGNAVEVAAKRVPHFKTGKDLHARAECLTQPAVDAAHRRPPSYRTGCSKAGRTVSVRGTRP